MGSRGCGFGAASCDGASEWSQIEELYGTKESDWEDVPVPDVAEGDEIEPCSEDADTSEPDNSPATGAPTISGTAQVGETLEGGHIWDRRRRRVHERCLHLPVAG